MTRITRWRNAFEGPDDFDPANYGAQMGRIADQVDAVFRDLTDWQVYEQFAGAQELGTPAIVRSANVNQTGYAQSTEKSVAWDTLIYDNTGTTTTGELILPDMDQRYWWWMGVNLFCGAITAGTRYTTRLYVQDRDPATGQVVTNVVRYNQYYSGSGDQYMTFDSMVRTGGGRQRVTLSHGGTAGTISVLAGSFVWAVRICPDR